MLKWKQNDSFIMIRKKIKYFYYRYLISDEKLLRKRFKKRLGRELNLSEPQKFNDKLQWLKLNWSDPLATICADKYLVRDYVEKTIGRQYLNEVYEVYDSVEDINLKKLPDTFVLKGTHGSGYNFICNNKETVDWNRQLENMKGWFKTNYYWQNREPVYKNIKPRIICERFLEQYDGEELRDYRFFCFNGEPRFVTIDFSITNKKLTRRNLYDLNWNLLEAEISYPKELNFNVEKPRKLEEMIELSRKLSAPFPHSRIDFYYIKEQIIFGEITFFHQSGMGKIIPPDFESEMGEWLKLPINV